MPFTQETALMRRGSIESDQNKRPLHLTFAMVIGGAGFSCRIGRKILVGKYGAYTWRVKTKEDLLY